MKILTDIVNDNVINALGWTLFHTLWQGFILAFVLGIILFILRYKSSNLRYIISLFSLTLIVGLSIFNFTNNYSSKSMNKIQGKKSELKAANSQEDKTLFIDISNQVSEDNVLRNISGLELKNKLEGISKYFPTIVYLWLIGIIIFQLKFLISYFYVNRLKRTNTGTVSNFWQIRFERIRKKLKLSKAVQFLESNLIKTPMVLGYFKPVILIPTELLTGMPSNQIESVIAHELAHIRRNDYIINVLQTVIETLFFFHPAVWYISAKIRDERENCCDDIAISLHNDSIAYAKALVLIQEFSLNKHYSAVAFSGRKKHLLNRIKRMIMKPKKTNITDKIIATIIIIAGIMAISFTYAATNNDYDGINTFKTNKTSLKAANNASLASKNDVLQNDTKKPRVVVNDTIHLSQNDQIEIDDQLVIRTCEKDGKKYKMKFTLKNGKATDLYVNGEKIPENEYDKYQNDIDDTIQDLKSAKKDIQRAQKELEELNVEEIRKNIEESMRDVHIDMEKIEADMAAAMESVKNIDFNDIMKEVEMNLDKLEDFDFDFEVDDLNIDMEQVRKQMEEVRKHIKENVDTEEIRKELEKSRENIDYKKLQFELQKAKEEISKMDMEKIKLQVEKNLQEFETYDKQKTLEELQEKLQELENLELEEK